MDLKTLLAQKKAAINSGNRQKTIKPIEGRGRYRILPSWRKEGGQFWHDFGQHFIKDGTGELKAVYVCVDKTFGKPCDICSGIKHAMAASHDDAMVELLKKANAAGRVLVNALDLNGESASLTEPKILELSPKTFADFIGICDEWDADKVLDLANGMDIIIERTGKGLQTKYTVQVASKSQPVSPEVMKKVTNLDDYVKQESEEQARRALTNLSAVAGVLPAPTAARKPSLTELSVDDVDETLTIAGEPMSSAPAPAAAAPAPATPAPTAPAAAASTGDQELDDLLAELG